MRREFSTPCLPSPSKPRSVPCCWARSPPKLFLSNCQPLSNFSRCESSWIYPFCFHILSHSFGATKRSQPLSAQSLAHSFPCNGGGAPVPASRYPSSDAVPCELVPLFSATCRMLLLQSLSSNALVWLPGMSILHEPSPCSPPGAGLLLSRNILCFPVTPGCGIIQRARGTANLDLAQGGSR